MGNLFDGLQSTVFKTVQRTMGYPALWQPLAGGDDVTATVLFKDATARAKILDVEYDPKMAMMEFQLGDFDALVESIRKYGREEIVTINTIEYGVLNITSKYDGKSYYAELQQL